MNVERLTRNDERLTMNETVGAGSARPIYSTAVFNLYALDLYFKSSFSFSTFCSQKVAKTSGTSWASHSCSLLVSQHVSTRSNVVCRSCLNVSISGTTELAFHAQASTLFSTAQTSAVQFPLLELTLTLAQHHAGFLKKIPFANKTSVHVGADRRDSHPCFVRPATNELADNKT